MQHESRPADGIAPSALDLLHPAVREWVAGQGWKGLRPVQERALKPVLRGTTDVLVVAATAAGKTEAAFLPACSRLLARPVPGVGILAVSPLKALINDQLRRLGQLCRPLGIPLSAWHGDIAREARDAFLARPAGILLITPESLETLLARHGAWSHKAFPSLQCIVVDEFHAFGDTERGRQLASLLHRLDAMARRPVPRIALSATMGDPRAAREALRPKAEGYPCRLVLDGSGGARPAVELHGYRRRPPFLPKADRDEAFEHLADDLFLALHGGNHLVFAGSRSRAEELACALAGRCRERGLDNEFFPHHASLATDIRHGLERRLQEGKLPTTAICTMTLELGIDLGCVDSVAQLGAPASVASLRQRLGRSGRRGGRPRLALYIAENGLLQGSSLTDRLRLRLFRSVAALSLVGKRRYEDPQPPRPHYSTLVQQALSVASQYESVLPSQLWTLLCSTGPFPVGQEDFIRLLRGMVQRGLLERDPATRRMHLADRGRQLVMDPGFSQAFATPAAYALLAGGQRMGSLPLDAPLEKGQCILFAGRSWKITAIDEAKLCIELERAPRGEAPHIPGRGQDVPTALRQEMLRFYREGKVPEFCDAAARRLFAEGLDAFRETGLARTGVVTKGRRTFVFPWLGDRATRTLARLLGGKGLETGAHDGVLVVQDDDAGRVRRALEALAKGPKPSPQALVQGLPATLRGKYDAWVGPELAAVDLALRHFDVEAAWDWLQAGRW